MARQLRRLGGGGVEGERLLTFFFLFYFFASATGSWGMIGSTRGVFRVDTTMVLLTKGGKISKHKQLKATIEQIIVQMGKQKNDWWLNKRDVWSGFWSPFGHTWM